MLNQRLQLKLQQKVKPPANSADEVVANSYYGIGAAHQRRNGSQSLLWKKVKKTMMNWKKLRKILTKN
jgi:hypothetical protein